MIALQLLPWIAHKNGITEQLALNLWRRAAGEAENISGCCNSSDYYRLAVNRFIELVGEKGENCAQRDPLAFLAIIPDASCLQGEQNRYWDSNQLATKNACGLWLSNLKFIFFGLSYQHQTSGRGSVTGAITRPHAVAVA